MKPSDILLGRILIVDDLEANVILLEEMLKGAGYTSVSSTRDPSRVCELHLLNRYDLILLDLLMPGMDGFQVMENLATIETEGYLPVLVVTAQSGHKLRALQAGARDFVSKPFDLAEVLIRVHNLLEVRLLQREARELCERIQTQKDVSGHLLAALLPPGVPAAPAGGPEAAIRERIAEVTMLFANLQAFTAFAEGAGGKVLKAVLDGVSSDFDQACPPAPGLPGPRADRAMAATGDARELVEAVGRFNGHNPYRLALRMGLDAAPT
ncbi:response regulator [Geothrix sp. 21YS21S-2]|uniref:response regulator n=1 Tax=Geothrix sp. 21YS21S-2 TaxID=3068893 RepID=UPI0027BA474A|nr:response regulator [Geothrix sp. 21YS21S-2]